MAGQAAGRLRNAREVEALTIDLIPVDRRYEVPAGMEGTDV